MRLLSCDVCGVCVCPLCLPSCDLLILHLYNRLLCLESLRQDKTKTGVGHPTLCGCRAQNTKLWARIKHNIQVSRWLVFANLNGRNAWKEPQRFTASGTTRESPHTLDAISQMTFHLWFKKARDSDRQDQRAKINAAAWLICAPAGRLERAKKCKSWWLAALKRQERSAARPDLVPFWAVRAASKPRVQ